MGMLDALKGYTPIENPEFGAKKKLKGDAVAQIQSLEKITGKASGKDWVILKCEAINCIPDPKGRETTLQPGDELSKVYDPENVEDMQKLANDLFTIGIEYSTEVANDDELIANMAESAKGKLVYFRTWVKDKTQEQIEKSKPGSPDFYQNIIIKPKKLITPENSVPQLPF